MMSQSTRPHSTRTRNLRPKWRLMPLRRRDWPQASQHSPQAPDRRPHLRRKQRPHIRNGRRPPVPNNRRRQLRHKLPKWYKLGLPIRPDTI